MGLCGVGLCGVGLCGMGLCGMGYVVLWNKVPKISSVEFPGPCSAKPDVLLCLLLDITGVFHFPLPLTLDLFCFLLVFWTQPLC